MLVSRNLLLRSTSPGLASKVLKLLSRITLLSDLLIELLFFIFRLNSSVILNQRYFTLHTCTIGDFPYGKNTIFRAHARFSSTVSYVMEDGEYIIEKFKMNPCLTEVLQLYCDGFNGPQIACITEKAPDTIERQFEKILEITNAPNMHRAMAICLYYGIIKIGYVGE